MEGLLQQLEKCRDITANCVVLDFAHPTIRHVNQEGPVQRSLDSYVKILCCGLSWRRQRSSPPHFSPGLVIGFLGFLN
jgi:hypothetical protein